MQDVAWSLSGEESGSTVITPDGELTIGDDESAGEITVIATPTSDPSKVGRATVTVKRVDVSLAVTKVTLTASSTYTFNATVYGTNGVSQDVAWSLAGAKSNGTSISPQGVLTVAEDEPSGTLTVKATSVDDPTGTAEVAVTVKGQAVDDGKAAEAIVEQIAAIPATGSLTLEDAATIAAARMAYDSLTDEQEALVPDETLAALVSAEAKIKELKDASGTGGSGEGGNAGGGTGAGGDTGDSGAEPAATVVVDGITLVPDKDYELSYKGNMNIGTAIATVAGKGNYTGSQTATFEIAKAEAGPSGQNPTSPAEKPGAGTDASGDSGTQPDGNNGKGLSTGETAAAGAGAAAASYTATGADTVTFSSVASKDAKSITVPDTVVINGKAYKVTKVADNAFNGSSATSIVIGANVAAVTAKTFAGAGKVKTITLGKNVKKVAAKSFAKNKSLRTLIIKTTKLAKKSAMKSCLKGSKVTKVQVKVGTKAQNKKYVKKYVKKYKKLFAAKKPVSGKKVSVK